MKKLAMAGAIAGLLISASWPVAAAPPRPAAGSAFNQMPALQLSQSYNGTSPGIVLTVPPGRYVYDHENQKGVFYRYEGGFVSLNSLGQDLPGTIGGVFLPYDSSKPARIWYPGAFGPITFVVESLDYAPQGPGFPKYREPEVVSAFCQKYAGTTVTPQSFEAVAAVLKPAAVIKDEFETSAAYEARAAAARRGLPTEMVVAMAFDPAGAVYNADDGEFTVSKSIIPSAMTDYESVFGAGSPFQGQVSFGPAIGGNVDITVDTRSVATGSYPAQNSFGASATITKFDRTDYVIFDRKADNPLDILLGDLKKPPILFHLSAQLEQARQLKPNLRMAVVMTPRPPFFAVGRPTQDQPPTVASPIDVTRTIQAAVGNIRCLLLTDASGKVLVVKQTN